MALRTRYLYVKDLVEYVESAEYLNGAVVPISPHRARAQALNPRAKPHDLALLLVYEHDALVAYIGALPDVYYTPAEEVVPIAYLSCMWVSPTMRGRGLASKIMLEISDFYQKNVFVTGFAPETKVLYDKLGYYQAWFTPTGVRGYLRPNFAQILPVKGGIWAKIKPVLGIADAFLGFLNDIRLLLYRPQTTNAAVWVNEVNDEIERFIQSHNAAEHHRRDRATLQWIMTHPWVLETTPSRAEDARRYYFSSIAKHFSNKAFITRSAHGDIQSFVLFSRRDQHIKIVYAQIMPEAIPHVAAVLYHFAVQNKVAMLTVFHQDLARFIVADKASPFFYKRQMQNKYLISNKFNLAPEGVFQDGDGDAAFT